MLNKKFADNIENAETSAPQNNKWANFLKGLNMFTDDFMKNGREHPNLQNQNHLNKPKNKLLRKCGSF